MLEQGLQSPKRNNSVLVQHSKMFGSPIRSRKRFDTDGSMKRIVEEREISSPSPSVGSYLEEEKLPTFDISLHPFEPQAISTNILKGTFAQSRRRSIPQNIYALPDGNGYQMTTFPNAEPPLEKGDISQSVQDEKCNLPEIFEKEFSISSKSAAESEMNSSEGIFQSNFYQKVDMYSESMKKYLKSHSKIPFSEKLLSECKILRRNVSKREQNYGIDVQLFKLDPPNEFIPCDEEQEIELEIEQINQHTNSKKILKLREKKIIYTFYTSQQCVKDSVWYQKMPFEHKMINLLSIIFVLWMIAYSIYVSVTKNKNMEEIVDSVEAANCLNQFLTEAHYLVLTLQEINAVVV